MKVFGTETLDFVVDEALQMLGGYGFVADYPIERQYRDSRINRIFEGTNEINRLLIPATMMKRVMTQGLPMLEFMQEVEAELAERQRPPHARRRHPLVARDPRRRIRRSASSPTPPSSCCSASPPRSAASSSTSRSSPT